MGLSSAGKGTRPGLPMIREYDPNVQRLQVCRQRQWALPGPCEHCSCDPIQLPAFTCQAPVVAHRCQG